MQDAFSVPSCPANVPEVSRGRRLPCLMSTSPATGRMAHRVRPAPAARRSSGMAHPCPRGCISRRNSAILAYRANCDLAPGRRHPRAMAAHPRRISTGRLVSQSVGMAPDHAATGRLLHGRYDSASTKAAPEKSCYHPCRCCAKGRFSAPSLPDSRVFRWDAAPLMRRCATGPGVVTGLAPQHRPPAPPRCGRGPPARRGRRTRSRPPLRAAPARRRRRARRTPPGRTPRPAAPLPSSATARYQRAVALSRTPWSADASTGWAGVAATARDLDDDIAASARPAEARCVAAMPTNQLRTSFVPNGIDAAVAERGLEPPPHVEHIRLPRRGLPAFGAVRAPLPRCPAAPPRVRAP